MNKTEFIQKPTKHYSNDTDITENIQNKKRATTVTRFIIKYEIIYGILIWQTHHVDGLTLHCDIQYRNLLANQIQLSQPRLIELNLQQNEDFRMHAL